jgi:hypothetical protein
MHVLTIRGILGGSLANAQNLTTACQHSYLVGQGRKVNIYFLLSEDK